MNKSPLGILTLSAMCLTTSLLVACTGSTIPSPMPTSTNTPQPQANFQLPAPVYLLREGQIWRLERDGTTQRQITHEPAPVNSFDVSPADDVLVYVSGNALIYADADGKNLHKSLSLLQLALNILPIKLFSFLQSIISGL